MTDPRSSFINGCAIGLVIIIICEVIYSIIDLRERVILLEQVVQQLQGQL